MKFTLLFISSVLFTVTAFARQLAIKGKITDDHNQPIPFASIYVKNTIKGTSANYRK